MSDFERSLTDGARRVEYLRRDAERWRKAALTARCGLTIKAGTYEFDRGMASIMSKALEENAQRFDDEADATVAHLQEALRGGGR